ncbi:MAG: glycoside hydrolase family 9 protein [Ruminococcus sp.]|nr:glycoside hydrolase family 9 protein [Ruminococcus sp.]
MAKLFINQIGYCKNLLKTAIFSGSVGSYTITDSKLRKKVFTARPVEERFSSVWGERISVLDFTALKSSGEYFITAGQKKSDVFTITDNPYRNLRSEVLKTFYINHCDSTWEAGAGAFSHLGCHTKRAYLKTNPNVRIDVSGGWHEGPGYSKSVNSTSAAISNLIYAQILFDNSPPNAESECEYGLNWLLKMQRADGAVYSKVCSASVGTVLLPPTETSEYYVDDISRRSALAFISACSLGSRFFADKNHRFSDTLRSAAEKSWIWFCENCDISKAFADMPGTASQEKVNYDDDSFKKRILTAESELTDEFFRALCEVYAMTEEQEFFEHIEKVFPLIDSTGFYGKSKSGFGTLALMFSGVPLPNDFISQIKLAFRVASDNLISDSSLISRPQLEYPSNKLLCTDSVTLMAASILLKSREMFSAAFSNLNYICGGNPMDKCYLTGFGKNSVKDPRCSLSASSETGEPVPGLLVTGADSLRLDNYLKWTIPAGTPPGFCYADSSTSPSSNEVSVFTNSALYFLLCAVDYFSGKL